MVNQPNEDLARALDLFNLLEECGGDNNQDIARLKDMAKTTLMRQLYSKTAICHAEGDTLVVNLK